MSDHEQLSSAAAEALRPVMHSLHAIGYSVVSLKVAPHAGDAPSADFGGCTTSCEVDENGHMVCRVHCP